MRKSERVFAAFALIGFVSSMTGCGPSKKDRERSEEQAEKAAVRRSVLLVSGPSSHEPTESMSFLSWDDASGRRVYIVGALYRSAAGKATVSNYIVREFEKSDDDVKADWVAEQVVPGNQSLASLISQSAGAAYLSYKVVNEKEEEEEEEAAADRESSHD